MGSASYNNAPPPATPTIWTANLYYPQNGKMTCNITAITLDITTDNGSRITPAVTSGGPGKQFVALQITAENTKVFQYLVRIYCPQGSSP